MPAEPRSARRSLGAQAAHQLQALFGPQQGRRGAALAAVLTSVTGLAAVWALLLSQAAHWGH